MSSLLPLVQFGAFILGIALIVRGWSGRQIDHRLRCSVCGFDLSGLPDDAARCPECGADLEKPRAVGLGCTRQRPALIVTGAALIVVVCGGLWARSWMARNQPTVAAYKPTWLLLSETTPERSPNTIRVALTELEKRMQSGDMKPVHYHELVNRGIAHMADRNAGWNIHWGRIVETGLAKNRMDRSQKWKFGKAMIQRYYGTRDRVERGKRLPFAVRATDIRTGNTLANYWLAIDVLCVHIDDECFEFADGVNDVFPIALRQDKTDIAKSPPITVPPGEYKASFRVHFAIFQGAEPEIDADVIDRAQPGYLTDYRRYYNKTITVLPEGQSPVKLVTDPKIENELRAVLGEMEARLFNSGLVALDLYADFMPIHIAFDVEYHAEGKMWRENASMGKAATTDRFYGSRICDEMCEGINQNIETIDIRLIPNPEWAATSYNMNEIWGKPIWVRDVPVD